jgi:hypothetical protein
MSTGWFRKAVVLVAGIALSAGMAFARDHRSDGRQHQRRENIRQERRWNRRSDHRWEARRDHYRDRQRFERERWRERREHDRGRWTRRQTHNTPQGWTNGNKKGWNGGSVPPGQEKRAAVQQWHGNQHGR